MRISVLLISLIWPLILHVLSLRSVPANQMMVLVYDLWKGDETGKARTKLYHYQPSGAYRYEFGGEKIVSDGIQEARLTKTNRVVQREKAVTVGIFGFNWYFSMHQPRFQSWKIDRRGWLVLTDEASDRYLFDRTRLRRVEILTSETTVLEPISFKFVPYNPKLFIVPD